MRTADIRHTRGEGWYYKVRALNGEAVAMSEVYTRRSSAVRAVKSNTDAVAIRVFNRGGRLVRTINI